jgi:hypothetical protein
VERVGTPQRDNRLDSERVGSAHQGTHVSRIHEFFQNEKLSSRRALLPSCKQFRQLWRLPNRGERQDRSKGPPLREFAKDVVRHEGQRGVKFANAAKQR